MQDPTSATHHTLTRAQVAARLGISTTSVRRLEWDELHPVQDARGVWRFDPNEVAALAPRPQRTPREPGSQQAEQLATRRRGRLAARVFLMFTRDRSLVDIVVATKQPPDVVRELYREWSATLAESEWDRREREGR
jgi:hypothetical protein